MIAPSASPTRHLALAAGGTAGHVTPALAVAAAYRARHPAARVTVIGSATGFERELIAAHGCEAAMLPAAPLRRTDRRGQLRALGELAAGIRRGRAALRGSGVQLVLGFGGYASAGAVLAARSLGLPTLVHEANVRPGLANRILFHLADGVLLGFPPRRETERIRWTGTPIRAAIAALHTQPRRPPARDRLHVLVCGGSQGSAFLNRRAPELAAALAGDGRTVEAWHQGGRHALADTARAYEAAGVAARCDAHIADMAEAYAWADVAVSSAGAATLAELAAVGLPALLVPLAAAADDHQAENAAAFAAASGVPWTRERDWDAAALARRLAALLDDLTAWQALVTRIRAAARIDAADRVVAACDRLLIEG